MKDDLLKLFIDTSEDFIYEINLDKNDEILWHKDISKHLNYPNNNTITSIKKFTSKLSLKHKEKYNKRFTKKSNNTIHFEIEDFYGRNKTLEDKYVFIENTIIGVIKDITDITHELKQVSQDGYKYFFEANKIPILIISPNNGKILDANNAALNFYGYSEKELKQLYIYNINTLSQEEINHEMQLAQQEQRDCFNFKHRLKSGKTLDVEVYSGPIQTEEHTLLYSVIFDISQRKKAEQKLVQAHTIYQNTKEGIFITDIEGNFLSVNNAFEKILGYSFKEIKDKNIDILKSSKQNKTFYKKIKDSLLDLGQWEGEVINKTKKGKLISHWLSINTVYNEDKEAENFIYVFSDFTKLKEQEKLIREKDQFMFHQSKMASMGEMLRNIAHQWRQPLAVISVASSGLKLKRELNIVEENDFEDFFESITKSTQYLSDTIEDFSNYFRNENVKKPYKIENAIEKTIQLLRSSFRNHGLKISIDIKDDITLGGVKNELVQVLLNILNNAKDAYDQTEKVRRPINIKVSKEQNMAIIELEDRAGGIEKEILTKIFDPYFTTKHQSQGTGIGLYMSLEIIQSHMNGNIEVSNIQGKNNNSLGAKFKITIPIS